MSAGPTRLRDTLRLLSRRSPAPLVLPREPAVAKALGRIPADLTGLAAPVPGRAYHDIARRLAMRLHAGVALSEWELLDAAWCLWATRPALAHDPRCRAGLLAAFAAQPQQRLLRALASSWMMSFDPQLPGVAEAGRLLRSFAPRMGPPWAGLDAGWAVFDESDGPRRVAEAALAARTTPARVLRQAGLGRLGSGYVRACLGQLLDALAAGRVREPMARLADVRTAALRPDGSLAFPALARQVCEALLRPFGERAPDESVRDAYLAVLLKAFGDPRLRAANWSAMPQAGETARHWLTDQALRQFLDAADRAAAADAKAGLTPASGITPWATRRSFWRALQATGQVHEAWAVLAPADIDPAKRTFGEQASFGRFQRDPTAPPASGEAVLLLRVGARAVLAEWSGASASTLWLEDEAPGTPRLFKTLYRRDELGGTPAFSRGPAVIRIPHDAAWATALSAALAPLIGPLPASEA